VVHRSRVDRGADGFARAAGQVGRGGGAKAVVAKVVMAARRGSACCAEYAGRQRASR
jgi:hypothetical protein